MQATVPSVVPLLMEILPEGQDAFPTAQPPYAASQTVCIPSLLMLLWVHFNHTDINPDWLWKCCWRGMGKWGSSQWKAAAQVGKDHKGHLAQCITEQALSGKANQYKRWVKRKLSSPKWKAAKRSNKAKEEMVPASLSQDCCRLPDLWLGFTSDPNIFSRNDG